MATSGEEAILYVSKKFKTLGIESLIVGASARDIVAQKFNFPLSERRTSDVDFAVLVKDWNQLREIEEILGKDHNISRSAHKGNHVRYNFKALPFDIVPFGGIEKENKVSWPPFYDSIMTVLGYQEALETAFEFEFGQERIKVVCPEVLIALKLIAWDENRSRSKDLDDIWYLLKNYKYIEPAHYEYALENLNDKFGKIDYEEEFSSSLVLGFKLGQFLQQDTADFLREIFSKPLIIEKIVAAITSNLLFIDSDDRATKETSISSHINALILGVD